MKKLRQLLADEGITSQSSAKQAARGSVKTVTEVVFTLELPYDPNDPSIQDHIANLRRPVTPEQVAHAVLENNGVEELVDVLYKKIDGLKIPLGTQFDSIDHVKIRLA